MEYEIVEINGKRYALYGWNGERYLHCWEVDEIGFYVEDGKEYEIMPIYEEIDEDEFEITGYEII